jgi:hypothetical protein
MTLGMVRYWLPRSPSSHNASEPTVLSLEKKTGESGGLSECSGYSKIEGGSSLSAIDVAAPTGVDRWMSLARRRPAQPPRLRALSGDNHLITRAHGSLRWGETLGQNWPIRRPQRMVRLSLVANPRPWPRRARIVTPLRTVRKKRRRRRSWTSAHSVNRGAGAFCNGPKNSGGRTRTCDLRVMSPTSCQLLHPATVADKTTPVGGGCQAVG